MPKFSNDKNMIKNKYLRNTLLCEENSQKSHKFCHFLVRKSQKDPLFDFQRR